MNISFFQKFLIRNPILPVEFYHKIMDDQDFLYKEFVKNPLFKNAIYLASPELYNRIEESTQNKNSNFNDDEKLKLSILKYAIRMSSRCTPFGLFAGSSLGKMGDTTNLTLAETNQFKQHYRLDMDYLCLFVKHLSVHPFVQPYLKYYQNSTLYRLGETYRYVEVDTRIDKRVYDLTSIDYNTYIEKVMKMAKEGAFVKDLSLTIIEEEISLEDAASFVDELIESQVLISELEPSTIGLEMEYQIIENLKNILKRISDPEHYTFVGNILKDLQSIKNDLSEFDNNITELQVHKYDHIKNRIKNLEVESKDKYTLQSDLVIRFVENQVDNNLQKSLRKAIELLTRFSTSDVISKSLVKFKEAFSERYETREVPLVEALDIETGLGYAKSLENPSHDISFLADDLVFQTKKDTEETSLQWNKKIHGLIASKIIECIRSGNASVELTDEDLTDLPKNEVDFSTTSAVNVTLLKSISGNDVIRVNGCAGYTGAFWLGRFCHIDEQFKTFVEEITNVDEQLNPNRIIAEINHLPESRLGNVIQRPAFRKHEIPYAAKSTYNSEFRISIDDLVISIRNDKVILRSKKWNKEVVPMLSNAHNIEHNTLPIYNFLADMQYRNGCSSLSIGISGLMSVFKFIPRLVYKNIILFRALWIMDAARIKTITGSKDSITAFRQFLKDKSIPRYFNYSEGDQELLIDGDNDMCLKLFLQEIKNKESCMIFEAMINDYKYAIKDSSGNQYNNEAVFIFQNNDKIKFPTSLVRRHLSGPDENSNRDFLPGSEWLYIKIYCGYKSADKIVLQVGKAVESFLSQGVLVKWFFIRYNDPKYHLRFRFMVNDIGNWPQVYQAIFMLLHHMKDEKLSWKVSIDTYKRELERYGITTINEAESIFYHDSTMTASLIALIREHNLEPYRWKAALYSVYSLMELFEIEDDVKKKFAKNATVLLGKGLGSFKITEKTVNIMFKENLSEIKEIFQNLPFTDPHGAELMSIINIRNSSILPIIVQLRQHYKGDLNELLSSLVHMTVNRIFRSKNLVYEYLIYDFIERYLFSQQTGNKRHLDLEKAS